MFTKTEYKPKKLPGKTYILEVTLSVLLRKVALVLIS